MASRAVGKTTLAHQLMFAMASEERPALYFTVLGESPVKMLRHQQQFELFETSKVDRSIRFFNLSADAVSGNLDQVLARIVSEVQAHSPALVFVDSFRSIVRASIGTEENKLQHFIQELGVLLTSCRQTSFKLAPDGTSTGTHRGGA